MFSCFRGVCMFQKQMGTDPTKCLYFEDTQETERYCVSVKYERKQEEEKDVVKSLIFSHNVKIAMTTKRSDNQKRSYLYKNIENPDR